ncbi:hypothetical protein CSB20_13880 [bacterium DOLZORAL124_64_63]|nr:MAG: hypothetical protein CSB20_13880 [bacterium DOLZORAL124_64_63]
MKRERGIGLLAWALVSLVLAAFLFWPTDPSSALEAGLDLGLELNIGLGVNLVLVALGMAFFWRSCGGSLWAAGTAALTLVASPYTVSSLTTPALWPQPFALFAFGALVAALRRQRAGLAAGPFWWLLAVFLLLQAVWGVFGFQCVVLGVAVVKGAWFAHRIGRRREGWHIAWAVARQAAWPSLAMGVGVALVWRRVPPAFTADPSLSMPTSLPGLAALGLFAVGWWRRGYLPFQRRRFGRSFLLLGALGLGLALLGHGRFSWLLTVAISWWSAVGMEQLFSKYEKGPARWLAPLGFLLLVSLPALESVAPFTGEMGWAWPSPS